MASVTSTEVVSDIAEPNGWRYVRYRYDLLDNLGGNHIEYTTKLIAAGVDAEADMIALIPTILKGKKEGEQFEYFDQCSDGGDPLHFDGGGFWVKVTPLWGTWDEQFTAVAKRFWSNEEILTLVPYNDSWSRVSSNDKRTKLGITNPIVSDMNGDMQTAIDTRATLDLYTPYFDSSGNSI